LGSKKRVRKSKKKKAMGQPVKMTKSEWQKFATPDAVSIELAKTQTIELLIPFLFAEVEDDQA